MERRPSDIPPDALEDIAYLGRSVNRVSLLTFLTTTAYTRSELSSETGIAQTTVSRIINEFEDRNWIERTKNGEYEATPIGKQVEQEFIPLIDAISVIDKMGETVAWIQSTEEPLNLRYFKDATIWRPEPADPMAPIATYMNNLRTASRLHCLVGVAPTESFEKAMRDGVVHRGMRAEHVISEDEYSYLLNYPVRLERWREYVDGGANVYCYSGSIPSNILIIDDTVYIGKSQSDIGETYTVIESENDTVESWALDLVEKYRVQATPLTREAFAEKSSYQA